MEFLNKLSAWLNKKFEVFGQFVSENWVVYWVVLAIITAGGFIGHFFGWAFSLFVPGFFVYAGWLMKRKHEKSVK
jgi:hypothetical protein